MTDLRYPAVRRWLADTTWAILPGKLAEISELVTLRAQGVVFSAEEIEQRIGAASRRERRTAGSVAVLPLYGVVSQRMNLMSAMSGGTSTELFSREFQQALADETVSAIVIDTDSPGGSVAGVVELADEIYHARGRKPIVAVANSRMASAAYWIGSAADELIVTPGGEVGSIGVLAVHQDYSGAYEQAGIRPTIIQAGRYKAEGNAYQPLDDEARDYLQSRVDEYYDMFVRAVARGRGVSVSTVRGDFGEGRMFSAKQAVRLGMADRVETLRETVSRLSSSRRSTSTRAVRGEVEGHGDDQSVGQDVAADLDRRTRKLRLSSQSHGGI